MANDILKEFLVAVGFKVDTSTYKRMTEDVDRVGKRLTDLDHQDRARAEAEKKRTEERKASYNGLALALGGVAAAATAAAGVVALAVGKMVGGFDQFYFISQRTGASVNNLKAIGYAFSQVGSTAESALQAIESFAQKRRTNPGIDGLLRSYGVDTRGDTADVLNRSVQAIQDRHPYYTGAQVAGLLGITEEQFQTFTRYRAEIKRYREEYGRLQRDLNVNSDDTARASASISRSIGTVTATLGVLAEKFFFTVAPVLERMVDGLRRWIAAHPEEIDRMMQGIARALEAVGMGLAKVGEWFSDESNLNKFMGFWTGVYGAIERVVKIVTALLDAMFKLSNILNGGPIKKYLDFMFGGGLFGGSIFGTSAQAAEGPGGLGGGRAPGERPGIIQRGWNRVKRAFGRGDGESPGADLSATPGSRASLSGRTFDSKAPGVMKRLMEDFDLSKEEAGVVLGNLGHESAGFTAFEEGGNGPGRGWAQWTDPGRKRRFFEYARKNGLDPKSDEANYGFLKWELQNTHKHAISNMKRADGSDEKMRVFERDFEGAGVKAYGSRFRYMKKAMEAYDRSQQQDKSPSPSFRGGGTTAGAGGNMTPGGFNVDDALRSRPMGTTSNTNDNSRSVSQVNTVKVEVHGATDPAAAGAAAARGVGQAADMNLRNVQTAIR